MAEDSEILVLELFTIEAPAEAISTAEESIVRTECVEDKDSKSKWWRWSPLRPYPRQRRT